MATKARQIRIILNASRLLINGAMYPNSLVTVLKKLGTVKSSVKIEIYV